MLETLLCFDLVLTYRLIFKINTCLTYLCLVVDSSTLLFRHYKLKGCSVCFQSCIIEMFYSIKRIEPTEYQYMFRNSFFFLLLPLLLLLLLMARFIRYSQMIRTRVIWFRILLHISENWAGEQCSELALFINLQRAVISRQLPWRADNGPL